MRDGFAREFRKYAASNVLGMLGLSCYILADTYFVSKGLGTQGLAALNLAIPIYNVIHGCGLMLGMGGATKYSVYRAQGDGRGEKMYANTLGMAAALGAVFMVAGFCLAGDLARLFGGRGAVLGMTETYLQVMLLFSPVYLLNDVLICFVRNDGNPRLSMISMLVGSFTNIVLDYMFIFPMRMGMFGAVLATGCAPIAGILVSLVHFVRGKNHFFWSWMLPKPGISWGALVLGVPSLVTEVSSGIVIIVFNMLILNIAGNVGVAAYGVVANISLVVVAVFTGVAQGMQPIVSRARGRGEMAGTRRVFRYGVATVLAISFLVYAVVFFGTDGLVSVFNSEKNPAMARMAGSGLRLYFSGISFMGINIVLSMYFAACERAVPAQAVSLLRGIVLVLPMAFALSFLAGITGVWLAVPATELMVTAIGAWLYRRITRFPAHAASSG